MSYGDRVYPITLDGARLRLRELRTGDLDAYMAIVGVPEVTRFLTMETRNREQQAERLAADIGHAQARSRAYYLLATVERDSDEIVGSVRLGLDQPPHGELGYAIRPDRWGRGYATEAVGLMLGFGFDMLGLHRIQATCAPENEASQRVLAKMGFTYEGRLRGNVFHSGVWRDSLVYSILEDEWDARGG
jgi:[ribosomal protein S5]-alanine N-acetyltransferase